MAKFLTALTLLCVLASAMNLSHAIQCMSCANDCDSADQKRIDCSNSISRCLTVFLDKAMGEENLKFKGCAPPGSESLGCKETLNLGQFGDFLDKVFNKEIPRGYHCTCSGDFCNGSRSLTASFYVVPLMFLAAFLASMLGRY